VDETRSSSHCGPRTLGSVARGILEHAAGERAMTGSEKTTAAIEGPAWSAGAPGWVEHWAGFAAPAREAVARAAGIGAGASVLDARVTRRGGRVAICNWGRIEDRDVHPVAFARMRSGLFLPLFDELADPALVARLAGEAEEVGWHGVFVWDHVRWREPVVEVADPWITLAAIATSTERIRLGPMVTPLARRRPIKVAGGLIRTAAAL
jgi:hypothetical protein